MDEDVFFEVVVPLLELDRTCLIAVTTVLDDDNFYSKLVDLKNNQGEPLFKWLEFTLGCRLRKCRLNPSKCFHNIGSIPPWQSKRAHERVRAMMKGKEKLMMREAMGIRTSQHEPVFMKPSIDVLADPEKSLCDPGSYYSAPVVYIGIDPNGLRDSQYAIVSAFMWRGNMVVRSISISISLSLSL